MASILHLDLSHITHLIHWQWNKNGLRSLIFGITKLSASRNSVHVHPNCIQKYPIYRKTISSNCSNLLKIATDLRLDFWVSRKRSVNSRTWMPRRASQQDGCQLTINQLSVCAYHRNISVHPMHYDERPKYIFAPENTYLESVGSFKSAAGILWNKCKDKEVEI